MTPEYVMVPREAVEALLLYAEAQTCTHEETHRVGAIWTICRACGRKWADDEGGFVPYQDPPEIAAARAMLQAAPPAPVAHSKSEHKRRVAMGDANVLPPAPVAVQPDPVAWVPIHPRTGPLWSMTTDKPAAERGWYEVRPLVFASPSPAPVAAPVVTDAQFYEWAEREGYGQSMLRTHAKAGWDAAILAAQSGAGTRGEGNG